MKHITFHDQFEQGSEQWLQARCGLLTASEMHLIVNPPPEPETRVKKNGEPYKQREWKILSEDDKARAHIYELAAQRITKFVEPIYESYDMLRGKAHELEARAIYSERYAPVHEVGFITNDRWGFTLGYSPDGLVGEDGQIEIKSRKQKHQVRTLVENVIADTIPTEFVMQHQTGLLVTEREWIDFISFSEKLPMAVVRVHPDEKIQSAILEAAAATEAKISEIMKTFKETFQ